MDKLTVISFVGPSGAGKTTAIKALTQKYHILEEKYIELNHHQLDNRLMLSKWGYINYWFDQILKAKANGLNLLITDRCPLDTCAYVNQGNSELLNILAISIKELEQLGIFTKKILVFADFETLEARINDRLVIDKRRIHYNEANRSHNLHAYNFYQENIFLWDDTIDTSNLAVSDLVEVFSSKINDAKSK